MKNCKSLLASAAFICVNGALGADITIDDFNAGVHSLTITAPASPVGTILSANLTGLAGTLGGSRNVALRLDAGTSGSISSLGNTGVGSIGATTLGEDAGMRGTLILTYDANGTTLGNLDLTQGNLLNKFRLNLAQADHVAQFRIDVIDGATTASSTVSFGSLIVPINLDFPFAAFSNPSALKSADKIILTLIGVSAGDFSINNFAVVPEAETTAAAVMVAGFAVWLVRRRQTRPTVA